MAFINPFIMANRGGIPRLEATSVNVGTSNVTFNFRNHPFLNNPNFIGLVLFKLPSFTPPATAVPIVFNTSGNTEALTTLGGDPVTSAELNKSGIYLAVYDNGTLQLLTGI